MNQDGTVCLFVCLFKDKRDFEPTYDEKNKPVEEESADRGDQIVEARSLGRVEFTS